MGFFTPDEIEKLAGQVVRIGTLAEPNFKTGVQRYWNGDTVLETGSRLWQPLHGYGMIDNIPALGQGQAQSVTLTLSGVSEDVLVAAIGDTDNVSQQLITIYFQLFDEAWQATGSPIAVFWGFMQPPRVSRSIGTPEDGGDQVVTIECVNAFFNRSRPPFGRYTDADQQRRSPGDKFFSYIARTVYQQLTYPDY